MPGKRTYMSPDWQCTGISFNHSLKAAVSGITALKTRSTVSKATLLAEIRAAALASGNELRAHLLVAIANLRSNL